MVGFERMAHVSCKAVCLRLGVVLPVTIFSLMAFLGGVVVALERAAYHRGFAANDPAPTESGVGRG